ncbi:site-specific integrase [Nitrosomonas sp. Is24]|uniref:tyrosine-type recombinase/integrase n=1 Tax=Nitrosomonas sp. Is24 TaxID=3080533 RepID=UPI00294B71F9|nr:site-specific integrase [Nitrosomonas sp. Is24]MDV6341126.1 site-specific integrase [Nitrosomonas sp. Is24]
MASIRKLQSGNFQVQIRLQGLPSITKTFPKKKDAVAFSKQVEGNTELHRKLGKATALIPIFREWCNIYMAQYSGNDPSTAGRLYWWCGEFGDKPVTKIDEFMVDDGLIKLKKRNLTGSTINRYKSTLSAVFIYFVQHPDFKRSGFINPVRKETVSRFKENPSRDKFLTENEQERLLLACRTSHWERLYLLVLMALTTGARKGELLKLKWSSIDFSTRVARLDTSKNGKPRLLPLTHPVIKELMRLRENTDHLIFHSTIRENTPFDIKKSWIKALKQSNIDYCRFHDLRHTAASNLVKAGRTLFEVGTLLGHSSTTMTARYSHLAIQDTQNMVDSVMGVIK